MKNTIIRDIADFFCPLRCINCGRVGEIFCLRCRKNMSFGLRHCLLCGAVLEA